MQTAIDKSPEERSDAPGEGRQAMRKRQDEAKDEHRDLTEAQLDQVMGGQGIDIVRMPPRPPEPTKEGPP